MLNFFLKRGSLDREGHVPPKTKSE